MRKIFCILILIFSGRNPDSFAQTESSNGIVINWNLLQNQLGENSFHEASFVIKNQSKEPLEAGWSIYFNTIFLGLRPEVDSEIFEIKHLAGDFFVLQGKPTSPKIPEGDSLLISYKSAIPHLKNSHAPQSLILKSNSDQIIPIVKYEVDQMSWKDFMAFSNGSEIFIPSPENLYKQNQELNLFPSEKLPPFLPTPKQWIYHAAPIKVSNAGMAVVGDKAFASASAFLIKRIKEGYNPQIDRKETPIQIRIATNEKIPSEGYHLEIRGKRVLILASDEKGAFYGVQSFLALLPPGFWDNQTSSIELAQIEIDDFPSYPYRGLFLDVARNFQPKEQILKLLDIMAFYKLNKFHFNLANDEGWRLEIPGLPELTEFGSKRGFSIDEKEAIWPFYGSGASVLNSPGTGYYSVEDYQEILSYARERFIEVIPEFGVPAHSRAAILAMERRYEKFSLAGNLEAANEYRLVDPDDQSIYLSAQNFRDNTICVCQESTYSFYAHLVKEVKKMYVQTGIELKTWHTGGDEVPHGVWAQSPVCTDFIRANKNVTHDQLGDYFRSRVGEILEFEGIQLAGWEEIGQTYKNRKAIPNPEFSEKNWTLFAWNAVAGWGNEDMAYQLANAGYPVVICSSSNLYFDLAYDWDPDEPGHTWSGVSDLYQAWKIVPEKLFLSQDKTMEGGEWDWKVQESTFTKLTESGKKNIKGVQGQLWTETVKSPEMLEYYLFPKMLGLVERAWNADPAWSKEVTTALKLEARMSEWNIFSNVVGQIEIPRLESIFGGVVLRLPAPGIQVKDSFIHANVQNPGLIIRYSTEGDKPTINSPIYSKPIPYQKGISFRVFSPKGQGGMTRILD